VPRVPTETRIRRAAAQEFARHGVAGARVERIARRARANKERLYHYVGGKDALFAAALEDAMGEIAAAEPFAAGDLGAYAAAMLEFHRSRPELVQLLLAEGRHRRGRALTHPAQRRAHYAERVAAVRAAQAAGAIRDDVDARIVVYAVLALVVAAEALPGLTELILAADPEREPLSDAGFRAGLRRLLDRLLVPRGSSSD
jgi:AcrR family transcriptional regulator